MTAVFLGFSALTPVQAASPAAPRVRSIAPPLRPNTLQVPHRSGRVLQIPRAPAPLVRSATPRSTAIQAPAAGPGGTWSPLGPAPLSGAESCCTQSTPNEPNAIYGTVSGRVTSIASDPSNSSIVYAGTAGGGVWKSVDGGDHWSSTSAAQPSLNGAQGASAIGALAIDPNHPGVVYAGTGEDNGSDSQAGWGILKTTDGGASWTDLASGTFARHHIGGIVVDANNSHHVLAATDIGLYQSQDDGANWTQTVLQGLSTTSSTATAVQSVTDIVQDQHQSFTAGGPLDLYATVSDFCGSDGGDVFWSKDGGVTWTNITPVGMTSAASRFTAAAYFGNVYLSAADCTGKLLNMWTLSVYPPAPPPPYAPSWRSIMGGHGWFDYMTVGGQGQGDYDTTIGIDPSNPSTVIFGGITALATTDGGNSWVDIGRVYNGGVIHPDFHAIHFTGGGSFYAGTDGGIWSTTDLAGAGTTLAGTSSDWRDLNGTLNTIQFYQGTALDSSRFLGGAQDNGSPGNLPGAPAIPGWREYLDGDGGYTAINPAPGSTDIYTEVPHGDIWRGNSSLTASLTSPFDSFIEAGPCRASIPNSGDPACSDPTDFVAPFAMDPTDPQKMLAGTNRVFLTTDGGGTGVTAGGKLNWNPISPTLATSTASFTPAPDRLSVIYLGPSGVAGPVMTGSLFGSVFMTLNGSTASPTTGWTDITGNLPKPTSSPTQNTFIDANPWITGVAFNPSNPAEAWVTIGGINVFNVWHTLNAGAPSGTVWNQLSGVTPPSLPNESVYAIALDPTTSNPSTVYVGTATGVFVCTTCGGPIADTSATWTPFGSGLPNVQVNAITFTRDLSSLIAWTHGLGAWCVPSSHSTPAWSCWDMQGGRLASRPATVSWGPNRLDTFVAGTDGGLWQNWFDGSWHWNALGGQPGSEASAVSTGVGQLDVFVRGRDQALWQDSYRNGIWSWRSLGGRLAAEPSAMNAGNGQLVAFVKGTDNHLWSWSSSNGWALRGGVLATGPAGAVATPGSEFDAFVQGTDNHLWLWSSTAGWSLAGGVLAHKPAGTSSATGQLDAFVQGTDLRLWHWSRSRSWENLGGRLADRPVAVSWGSGRLDTFVEGTDQAVWHALSTGSGWQWESLGGAMPGGIAATTSGASTLDVAAASVDASLWHRAYR